MNWYKQADFLGRDPYKVDFAHEREKAKEMDTNSLLYALKDAIEASQVSVNEGKYYDQASVYRQELKNRGISFEDQDRQLGTMSGLHSKPGENQDPTEFDTSPCKDPSDPIERPRSNGKNKSHQSYPDLEKTNYYPPIV